MCFNVDHAFTHMDFNCRTFGGCLANNLEEAICCDFPQTGDYVFLK